MFDDWDRWACPGINCTDIDPKTGRGVIKYPKLTKKQKKTQAKGEARYVKAFLIYSALWFAAMILGMVFKWDSGLMVDIVFLGMFGWMYVPLMFL